MQKIVFIISLCFSTLAFSNSGSVTTGKSTNPLGDSKEIFSRLQVTELEKALETKKGKIFVFDANTDSTREKEGLIPGAKILASAANYEASTVLPADKDAQLVFYCANPQCMASHEAAHVAVKAGYKNVSILPDGIQGWKKAGKKTEKYSKKKS